MEGNEKFTDEKFNCTKCNKKFKNRSGVTTHLKFCGKKKCFECGGRFFPEELDRHDCQRQPAVNNTKRTFSEMDVEDGEEPASQEIIQDNQQPTFKGSRCTKSFKRKDHLTRHEKTHVVKMGSSNSNTKDKQDVDESFKIHHRVRSVSPDRVCVVCSKEFSRRDYAKDHEKVCKAQKLYRECLDQGLPIPEEAMPQFKCKNCPQSFYYDQALSRHKNTCKGKNADAQVSFKCNQCPKSYSRKDKLTRHQKTHEVHTETPEQKNSGTNLGLDVVERSEMIDHVHTSCIDPEETAKYKCTQCSKTFTRSDNLTRHEKTHVVKMGSSINPNKNPKPDVEKSIEKVRARSVSPDRICDVCSKEFTRRDYAKDHEKACKAQKLYRECVENGLPIPEEALPQCKCENCTLCFYHASSLSRHRKICKGRKHQKTLEHLTETLKDTVSSGTNLGLEVSENSKLSNSAQEELTGHNCQSQPAQNNNKRHLSEIDVGDDKETTPQEPTQDPQKFKCYKCTKTYSSYNDRNRHQEQCGIDVDEAEKYKCSQCSKTFTRSDNLTRHEKTHVVKMGSSTTPNSNTKDKQDVDEESPEKVRARSVSPDRFCVVCYKEFSRRDYAQVHQKVCKAQTTYWQCVDQGIPIPEDALPQFKCKNCPQSFYYDQALSRHNKVCKGRNADTTLSPNSYSRNDNRTTHQATHEDNTDAQEHTSSGINLITEASESSEPVQKKSKMDDKVSNKCSVCGKVLYTLHYKTVHEKICKAKQLTRQKLRMGLRIQSDAYPKHMCPNCLNIYRYRASLARHLKSCGTNSTDAPKFKCNKCFKTFTTSAIFRKHLKTCGMEIIVAPFFKCNTCFKTYRRSDSLKRHLATCEVEVICKDRICCNCKKVYTRSDVRKEHEKLCIAKTLANYAAANGLPVPRSMVQKFQCPVCSKLFAHANTTSTHLKLCAMKHGERGNHTCSRCHFFSLSTEKIAQHLNRQPQCTIIIKTPCPFCNLKTGHNKNCTPHIANDETKFPFPYKCQLCLYYSDYNWLNMLNHLSTCDLQKLEVVYCVFCDKKIPAFEYAIHAQKEIMKCLQTVQEFTLQCAICDMFFPDEHSLQLHQSLHTMTFYKTKKTHRELVRPWIKLTGSTMDPTKDDARIDVDQVELMIVKRYPCTGCFYSANSAEELRVHMKEEHKVENLPAIINEGPTPHVDHDKLPFSCYICENRFAAYEFARVQVARCERKAGIQLEKISPTPPVPITYELPKSEDQQTVHTEELKQLHSFDGPFLCRYCGILLSRTYNGKRHEEKCAHIGDTDHVFDNKFICEKCNKGYQNRNGLVRHLATCGKAVNKNIFLLNCSKCQKNFTCHHAHARHERGCEMRMKKVRPMEIEFPLSRADKKEPKRLQGLWRWNLAHAEVDEDKQCSTCLHTFYSAAYTRKHQIKCAEKWIALHKDDPMSELKDPCAFCGETYGHDHEYDHFIRLIDEEEEYPFTFKCQICDSSSLSNWKEIVDHLSTCELNRLGQMYCCFCQRMLPAHEYAIHIQHEILNSLQDEEQLSHQCTLCDLKLHSKESLLRHQDLHSMIFLKTYTSWERYAGVKDEGALQKMIKSFPCAHCFHSASSREEMIQHMRLEHEQYMPKTLALDSVEEDTVSGGKYCCYVCNEQCETYTFARMRIKRCEKRSAHLPVKEVQVTECKRPCLVLVVPDPEPVKVTPMKPGYSIKIGNKTLYCV